MLVVAQKSMVDGLIGVNSAHVACLVLMEQTLDRECATTLLHHMAERNVLVLMKMYIPAVAPETAVRKKYN